MTREELEQQMADYLGGEMLKDNRDAFEAQLAGNPALAREIAELRRAGSLVASLQVPNDAMIAGRKNSGAHRFAGRFAIAAAMVVAFLAGFGVRGINTASHETAPAALDPAEASRQAVERAWDATPSHSELARSFLRWAR
jgi:anti-sigma factor RsiW